jgi:hypothetical protein
MWDWLNCYLSGRHEYGKWCEPGAIFLRCVHCGRRSAGWSVRPTPRRDGEGTGNTIPSARATDRPGGRTLTLEREPDARG